MRIVVGLFLIAHGLVHLMYLAPRPEDDPNYPFAPDTRWLARWRDLEPGAAKAVAGSMAVATAVVLSIAGIALLVDAALWAPAAIAGALVSLALLLLFFHPWLMIGIAIDITIITSVAFLQIPSSLFEG